MINNLESPKKYCRWLNEELVSSSFNMNSYYNNLDSSYNHNLNKDSITNFEITSFKTGENANHTS